MTVYLYGLVDTNAAAEVVAALGDVETSRDLSPPRLLALGPVSLIVSDLLAEEIRPNRRNLLTHMRVLEAAFSDADVLPVQFGQASEDEGALRSKIGLLTQAIEAEFSRLSGQAELSIQVAADKTKVMKALAELHPELTARYAAVATKGAGGHFEMIELGRHIGELLDAWRLETEATLLSALEPFANAKIVHPVAEDTEVLRCNFLLPRTAQDALADALAESLETIDLVPSDALDARIIGPTPPGSFVRLEFKEQENAPLGSAA